VEALGVVPVHPLSVATRCTVPCVIPSSARNVLTIRTAAAFSSLE
jgi:hypothetical protein